MWQSAVRTALLSCPTTDPPFLCVPPPPVFVPPPSPLDPSHPQTTPAGAPLHDADEVRVKEVNKRLLSQQDLPEFEPVPLTLASLVAEGMRLVQEQELVSTSKLGEEYMVSHKRENERKRGRRVRVGLGAGQ